MVHTQKRIENKKNKIFAKCHKKTKIYQLKVADPLKKYI